MRNHRDITIGQLYTLASGEGAMQGNKEGCCCVCGVSTDSGFHILADKVVSSSYGEYADYVSNSSIVCDKCRVLFSNDNRQVKGAYMHYLSEQERSMLFIVGNEKAQTSADFMSFGDTLGYMLNPPRGYFAVAFNKFGNGTHFLPFARVNYNPDGKCDKYYTTLHTEIILIDIEFLNKYIAKARAVGRKIGDWEYQLLVKLSSNRKINLSEKIRNVTEFLELDMASITRNLAGITLINKMFRLP